MKAAIITLIITLCTQAALTGYVAPLYAEWAHSHVVWINGKEQNQEKFLKLVDDYEKRTLSDHSRRWH